MALGRPRSFDRDLALKRAMEVFWAKGYEGAQLVDLTLAMAINPPSFYAAFGTKEKAFVEAITLYVDTVGAEPMRVLQRMKTARAGLRKMLERSVDVALSTKPGGCLLMLGIVNCLPENEGVRAHLKQVRAETHRLILTRIQRGIAEGDLPHNTNAKALARHYLGVLQAISLQARDGASRVMLRQLIDPALAALPSPESRG